MRFSPRSKLGVAISVIAVLALVGAFAASLAFRPSDIKKANAASAAPVQRYTGVASKNSNIRGKQYDIKFNSKTGNTGSKKVIPNRLKTHAHVANGAAPAASDQGSDPVANAATTNATSTFGKIASNFNGLNSVDNAVANGFTLEPPDQGLCVGTLLGKKVVVEIINVSVTIYDPQGHQISGIANLNDFFGEPAVEFLTDPRCYFDPASHGFFFTILAADPDGIHDHIDVIFLRNDLAERELAVNVTFETNTGGACPCFGDQPKLGIDKSNIYLSVDQFGGPGENTETGADLVVLSKSQFISGAPVNEVAYLNLTFLGAPVLGLVPANVTNGSPAAEYFMNTEFLDKNGNNITLSHTLGLWALATPGAVTAGKVPELSVTPITSEQYANAVPAISNNGFALDTDDRMQQVQFTNGHLVTAIDTAVTIKGDPITRDGIAFFELTPFLHGDDIGGAHWIRQGYVAAKGKYLVEPALLQNSAGADVIGFSFTNGTTNPSTGYVVRPAAGSFGALHVAATGFGPDLGFSCVPDGGICRWGDYSATMLDPNGKDFWTANEYIVQPSVINSKNVVLTNWGTRITEVKGS